MVKLIVRRSEIDEATETRIKELEAQVKKLEMHTDPVSTSASHVQAPGTTSSRNRHRQLTMVQEIAGRVMDEAAEIRIKELEAQVKKLEDTTRELLGVVDIAELRRRKVRHAFLNAYSRSDKRDHREEGMKAGADCLTDATLYSRGERSDEAVFHAAYGVSPATISRYVDSEDRKTIAMVNLYASLPAQREMREWVASNVFRAYQQFVNRRFNKDPPGDVSDPYSGASIAHRYAWGQIKKFNHLYKSVKEGDTKESFLRAFYSLDGNEFESE